MYTALIFNTCGKIILWFDCGYIMLLGILFKYNYIIQYYRSILKLKSDSAVLFHGIIFNLNSAGILKFKSKHLETVNVNVPDVLF